MDVALVHGQVQTPQDLLVARRDVEVADLKIGHQATTVGTGSEIASSPGARSERREKSTSSASVVVCNERMIPPWTRVQRSLVAHPRPASGSCEQSTRS